MTDMSERLDDEQIQQRIEELEREEARLRHEEADAADAAREDKLTEDAARLEAIKVELDRCYDLLHQREARRAAGLDPEEATLRPVEVVERYQQ